MLRMSAYYNDSTTFIMIIFFCHCILLIYADFIEDLPG